MKKYIDLTLIKKLVEELENANSHIENLIEEKADVLETQIEIAKVAGLSLGIMNEAELLIIDYKKLSQLVTTAPSSEALSGLKLSAEDLLNSIGVSSRKKTNKN